MRVLLVWPKGFDVTFTVPLGLAYLKSNLDGLRHDVRILDCSLLGIDAESDQFTQVITSFKPEVVGVSSWSHEFPEAASVCAAVKRIDSAIHTILGGIHATVYPEHALQAQSIDFVMVGEGEHSFAQFLEVLNNGPTAWSQVPGLAYLGADGAVVRNPVALENDLDTIDMPDYDAIDLPAYMSRGYMYLTDAKRNAPIQATRGCPYGCKFCSASLVNGKRIRSHSVDYLVSMVRSLYDNQEVRFINIVDDNFTFHLEFAKEFCRAIIDLSLPGLRFATPNGVRIEKLDAELVALMRRAGWRYLTVAPESGSKATLERMGKHLDLGILPEKIELIRKAGLKVHGFFIIGYPGEQPDDVAETIALLRSCRLNYFSLSKFQPLPGTPAYRELVDAGEIQNGFLPGYYYDAGGYTPPGLEGINFGRVITREHIMFALRHPLNLPYYIAMMNPARIPGRIAYRLLGRRFGEST